MSDKSQMSDDIDKPRHDQLFRKAFENPLVAVEFMNTHLPKEVLKILDISTLKLEKDTFVNPTLTDSACDVLFSAKFNGTDGFIHILLEHQSSCDRFMAFRLFKYMLSICDQYVTSKPKAKHLPLVYPIVIYNGKAKYNAPLNIWQLFNNSNLAKDFWTNDYRLVNVHEIDDEELKSQIWSGITMFFLKHIHERNILKYWQEIENIIPEIVKLEIGYKHIEILLQYSLTRIEQDDKMTLSKLLTKTLNQERGENLMTSIAQNWFNDGEMKGIEKGKMEGKIETAKQMIKDNVPLDSISRYTNVSIKDLQKLL